MSTPLWQLLEDGNEDVVDHGREETPLEEDPMLVA